MLVGILLNEQEVLASDEVCGEKCFYGLMLGPWER